MKHYLLNYNNRQKYSMILFDTLLIAACVLLSYSIRLYFIKGHLNIDMIINRLDILHVLIIPVHLFTLFVFDLYNPDRLVNLIRSSIVIILSVLSAGLIISGFFFFLPKYVFGRQVMITHLIVLSFMLVAYRIIFIKIMSPAGKKKKIALVCNPDIATSFKRQLSATGLSGIQISHICCLAGDCDLKISGIKNCSSILDLLNDNQFDILGYDSSHGEFSNEEIRLILEMKQKNKGVYELSNLYTSLTGKVPLDFIDGKWLMNSQGLQGIVSKHYTHIKRIIDVTMAFSLLLILSPLIIITCILVKLESEGRAFFAQERLGRNRKPFMCYKFRTMVNNAEEKTGPVWSNDNDTRITKLGKFLRKTRLDELPQLWNILKGDLSFVGPRPIRKHFADMLSKQIPFYELRFSIQPGLSGWAQVNHDYAGSEDGQLEKFKYELFYIQNMSLFLDIIVIFKTIQSFMRLEGK